MKLDQDQKEMLSLMAQRESDAILHGLPTPWASKGQTPQEYVGDAVQHLTRAHEVLQGKPQDLDMTDVLRALEKTAEITGYFLQRAELAKLKGIVSILEEELRHVNTRSSESPKPE